MRLKCLCMGLLFVVVHVSYAQPLPPADEILDKSIAYHDPDGNWYNLNHEIDLLSRRPNGADRASTILLSHANAQFGMKMKRDGKDIESLLMQSGDCKASIDGSADISEEDREKYRLSCEGITRWRDYHGYMLGMPMNLRDPGTILDPTAKSVEFEGRQVISLKVTYTEEVGADTWYFYLDPESYALIGCRFYHDESKNDGEFLTFEGEASYGSIILPQTRKWYYNNNREFLGEDEIAALRNVGS